MAKPKKKIVVSKATHSTKRPTGRSGQATGRSAGRTSGAKAKVAAAAQRAQHDAPGGIAKRGQDQIEFIARGVLVSGSRVLLCRSVKHEYLYLPGGHVEFAESAAGALRREFLEECGLDVRVLAPLAFSEGTFSTKKRRHHEVNVVFHVEPMSKAFDPKRVKSREDSIRFEWIELAAIADLDVRPLATKALLATLHDQAGPGEIGRAEWISEIDRAAQQP